MSDKIKDSYRQTRNIYDDVLTRSKWWSRLYMDVFWGGIDDNEIAAKTLSYIPDDFSGKLLDVPVGTGVFTARKCSLMKQAEITCLDYSEDMLIQAKARFEKEGIGNTQTIQGDVGALPFVDESFDTVLSMNGIHVFPDKEKAWSEMHRILSKKGWFTPPFETFASLKERLEKDYVLEEYHKEGSMVYLKARKR